MNSGGHRGVTVVTVVTLIFAPVMKHHGWVWKLVGKTKESHIEKCVAGQPCPFHKRVVVVVHQPAPPGVNPRGGDERGDDQGDDN
jgi:hypothetical protein